MSLAARVAELATRIAQELRPVEGVVTTLASVTSSTLILRKVGGLVTLQGSVTLATPLSANTVLRIGTVPVGFRPPQQVGSGAYFYDVTGTAGAVLIAMDGNISVLHASGSRGACTFSAVYRVA